MIRGAVGKSLDHDPHFRWRGESVTRIENLSDIIFALALGMIVLSANIPQTFDELQTFLISFIPAFLSFVLLLQIWFGHYTFFRRFGVADTRIIVINVALLFFVLYAAYPLKFAFESFFAYVTGGFDNFERAQAMRVDFKRSGLILMYFTLGYGAINFCFWLMYRHALKKSELLQLSDTEIHISKGSRAMFGFMTILCLVVAIVCGFTPMAGFGGWLLALNWPVAVWISKKYAPPKA